MRRDAWQADHDSLPSSGDEQNADRLSFDDFAHLTTEIERMIIRFSATSYPDSGPGQIARLPGGNPSQMQQIC